MDLSKDSNIKRRKRSKSKKKKVRNKTGVLIFRIILSTIIILGFAFAGVCFGAWMGIVDNAPKLDNYVAVKTKNYTSIVYDKNGMEIDRFKGTENREHVDFKEIPDNLKYAFIAIEDERFYSHNGIDMRGILRSGYETVFQKNRQGASTITQQLIKNNITKVLKNDLISKLQEQYLAVKYENLMEETYGSKAEAKNYILEDYLNSIGLGHGLNGVQTASKYYFGTEVSELNLAQCAVIAAITQRPVDMTPDDNAENNEVRKNNILSKMLELNFITQSEYDEAKAFDVYSTIQLEQIEQSRGNVIHSYFSDALIEQLIDDLCATGKYDSRELAIHEIYNGGLQIYTTQDTQMQKTLENAFMDDSFFPVGDYEIDVVYKISVLNTVTNKQEHHEEKTTVKNMEALDTFKQSIKDKYTTADKEFVADSEIITVQPQAAMIIIDYHNGGIKAIVGGRGEKQTNRGFNRATQSERQPGSVFKILASYAPAIDLDKIGAGSVIVDEPFYNARGEQWPRNWNGVFKGPTTVREGIYNSMNVLAVRNMDSTGIDASFNYLLRFGFTTLVDGVDENGRTDRGLATALGGITNGVTQIEVTSAYGTIANGGIRQNPTFYTKVLDHEGNIILEYKPEENRTEVIKSTTAYLLTDMMKDVLTRGTGGKARFKEVKMPVAGKTGTTTDKKDLTFVGYTPYYVAGIWLGYDKAKIIDEDRGYHLTLWRHVMEEIHKNLEYKDFDRPNGITSATICLDSGKRAVPGLCDSDIRGNRTVTDLFAVGAVPSESCDAHTSVVIDSLTGRIADASTPSERRQTIVSIIKKGDSSSDIGIPESMVNGDPDTRLNDSYTGEITNEDLEYDIDPNTGEVIVPEENYNTQPEFPSFDESLINPQNPVEQPDDPSIETPDYTTEAPPIINDGNTPPSNVDELNIDPPSAP